MRALVTGSTGLVGSHLVRALEAEGHDVRALVRPTSPREPLAGTAAEQVVGDVLDRATLPAAVEGCEVVFHAASPFTYWGVDERTLSTVTVGGTRNLLEAAATAGVVRVVVTSSSVCCGSSPERTVRDERDTLTDPRPPLYYRVKAEQEQVALARGRELGIEVLAALPTMTVGGPDRRLVPSNQMIANYLEDPWRATFPGGCNIVAAADVAAGQLLIAERGQPGERYLLGSENLTWSQVHGLVAELAGAPKPAWSAGHAQAYLTATALEWQARLTGRRPSSTRAQAGTLGRYYWYRHDRAGGLGYRPRPARAALAEAVAWLLATGELSRPVRFRLKPTPEVLDGLARAQAASAS